MGEFVHIRCRSTASLRGIEELDHALLTMERAADQVKQTGQPFPGERGSNPTASRPRAPDGRQAPQAGAPRFAGT